MAPIARDMQSHLAFLEQEVSILCTHGCLQCEMLVHMSPVSHEHRLERHSLQTFARICVEQQTELQAEVAFGRFETVSLPKWRRCRLLILFFCVGSNPTFPNHVKPTKQLCSRLTG